MDYPEIIAEVVERAQNADIPVRAGMYTNLAEIELSKRLRVSEQESQASLTTDANGVVPLPSDFSKIRELRKGDYRVSAENLADVISNCRTGYAVRGSELVTSHTVTDLVMDYYAKLPSLETNSTNWLSTGDPEIYIFAILKQAFLGKLEVEQAQAAGSYLSTLIDAKQREDSIARFKGTKTTNGKVNP